MLFHFRKYYGINTSENFAVKLSNFIKVNLVDQLNKTNTLAKKSTTNTSFFSTDASFDALYPEAISLLAHRHWTPLLVAKKAAAYLAADKGAKILDIGSGVGKFCLAAAFYQPAAQYFGIEQRENLVSYAKGAQQKLQIDNVTFTAGNFTELKFSTYDHFYFYNSFYENLVGTQRIDDDIAYSRELYDLYRFTLYRQLEKMPFGTKLVTFQVLGDDWPEGYHVVNSDMDNLLNFLVKI